MCTELNQFERLWSIYRVKVTYLLFVPINESFSLSVFINNTFFHISIWICTIFKRTQSNYLA